VDKVILFSKLGLFPGNPALLGLADYEIHSLVSPSAVSDFVEALLISKFAITAANFASLVRLSGESGFPGLSDACKEFRVLHRKGSGQNVEHFNEEVFRSGKRIVNRAKGFPF
jgi:hypothetical protein